MGQRTFMIGNSTGRLGFFSRPLLVPAAFGFARRGGGGRRGCTIVGGGVGFWGRRLVLVGLGPALVRFAAVISLVKARALEDDGRPGPQQAPQLGFFARGTLLEDLVHHRLEFLELVTTRITFIIVGWHELISSEG